MMNAFKKQTEHMMERYIVKCDAKDCGFERQFFGTEAEARERARAMGWIFKCQTIQWRPPLTQPGTATQGELAYCPHCALFPERTK
jgi:hypothetical protein